jgi:hypothetical protein
MGFIFLLENISLVNFFLVHFSFENSINLEMITLEKKKINYHNLKKYYNVEC